MQCCLTQLEFAVPVLNPQTMGDQLRQLRKFRTGSTNYNETYLFMKIYFKRMGTNKS